MALETFGPLQSAQPTRVAAGCCPAPQCAQAPTTPLASFLFCLPGGQASQLVLFVFFCSPAGHERQRGGVLEASKNSLSGQGLQPLFASFGCLPVGHRVHCLWPGFDECLAAPQASHEVWFVFAACLPTGHGSHRPSVPAVPAGQPIQASCFALALLPERQVSHTTPRGEYRPALQFSQDAENLANEQRCPGTQ